MDVQGKFRSAEKLAQQATQIDPEFFPAWFQLGWARYELERYAEAEDSFRKAIALRPNFGAGFLGLGMILNATGRYLQSVSAFKKVLEINPDSVQGHFFLSFSYHYRGEHLKAVETLRAMLTMNPTHPLSAYAQLHVALQYKILERTSEQQTALEAAERMFKAQVGDPRAMVGLAGVQAIRGNTEQALDWLEQAVVKGFRYLNQINGSPSLDDLREHPRFSEIVKRIRLSLSSEP